MPALLEFPDDKPNDTMSVYIIHSNIGLWRLVARTLQDVRLTAAELMPKATIIRIEREGQW
jgi:hypothetical protein